MPRLPSSPCSLTSTGNRPAFFGYAHTSDIRTSAHENRQDQVRFVPASCGPDSWGNEAVRSEAAVAREDYELQACDGPRLDQAGAQHSQSPMDAGTGR